MSSNSGDMTQVGNLGIDRALSAPAARRVALLVSAVSLVIVLLSLGLALVYVARTGDVGMFLTHQLFLPVAAAIYLALGVLIMSRRPSNSIGWLFLAVGAGYSVTGLSAAITTVGATGTIPFPPAILNLATWLNLWVWIPTQMLSLTFVFLLFPDGHLPGRRWWPVAVASAVGLVLAVVGIAFHPDPVPMELGPTNPYGLTGYGPLLSTIATIGAVLLAFGTVGSFAAPVVRFRRSRGAERQQMKWLAYVAALLFAVGLLTVPLFTLGSPSDLTEQLAIAGTTLALIAIAVAATVAIVRYHLYDIDLVINRTLLFGALTACIVLIYVLVVGTMGALFQTQSNWLVALVATGLVAVLFNPLRERLQRGINRLVYGQRDEPFEVLSQLGQRLENSVSPDSVYPTIVETVAQTLRLPYAGIEVLQGAGYQLVESYGRLSVQPTTFPLLAQGEEVGRLLVGLRSPGEPLTQADERLLRNIARQAGTAVYEVQLMAELQKSRQEIVTSREEERRRLRRDLHDGLGPALASLHLETGLLRRLIRDDPDAAVALAEEMQGDIRTTIEDIRRVVHELRPPALDDLGLVPAINVLASRMGRDAPGEQATLRIQVAAPDPMPPLPAAVEVAAYRIVQEALANVIHHAAARCVMVRLALNGRLVIEVEDDGVGFAGGRPGGVGLNSMRERAAELGGRCTIERQPGGGTLVRAVLPLANTPT